MTLTIQDLSFSYPRKRVLCNINLRNLKAGQLSVLIGPNATGKSTLFRCIAGLLPVRSGAILLASKDIYQVGRRAWNDQVCFMPQSFTCNAALSVFDVVLLARMHLQGWRVKDDDIDSVAGILQQLGIEHLADTYIGDLSGGQQQMVSICQALVRSPTLFLLDEPTSALDLRHQLEIMSIVRKVTSERNITTIVSLHDLNLAARFADQLILMGEGRVIDHGDPVTLLASEQISKTYSVNLELHKTDSGMLTVAASL